MLLSENNESQPTLLSADIDRRNSSIIWEKGYLKKTEQGDKHFVNPFPPELQLNQIVVYISLLPVNIKLNKGKFQIKKLLMTFKILLFFREENSGDL